MKNSPCYHCESRKSGCHAVCEKYAVWKSNHEKQNAELREKRMETWIMSDYSRKKVAKLHKKLRKRDDK